MKAKERVFNNVTEQRRKTMSKIRGKNTTIEVTLQKALWAKGYRYRKNYKKLPGSPDICLTKYRIAIFCDSEFFHGKDWEVLKAKVEKGNNGEYWSKKIQENITRDNEKDKALNALGWTVIHFWGKDILKKTDECVKVIEETIFELEMEVWKETKQILINGLEVEKVNGKNYNNFPKASDNPICHVRPHARNAQDVDELPDGRMFPKQCFWLNKEYILSQLDENFLEE